MNAGKQHRSRFPEGVPDPVQYDPSIKAAAVHFTQYQLLPIERTTQLLGGLYGLRLSPGTVHTSVTQAAQAARPDGNQHRCSTQGGAGGAL